MLLSIAGKRGAEKKAAKAEKSYRQAKGWLDRVSR
jgi:hypothetical protein